MGKIKKIFCVLCAVVLILFSSTYSIGFTIKEERELGEKLFYAIRSNFELLDDLDVYQYINSLGNEVLAVSGVEMFDYHFNVIKDKNFNAFAAPAGLIFFNSGLIEEVEDENELISVVAHEIGHVKKRHLAERLDKSKKVSLATIGAILAAVALGSGEVTEALFVGSIAAGESAKLAFSRENEEEADRIAYDWMKKINRNPEGQVRMLQTMRRIARYRSGVLPQYLLTHPNPEVRLDYVQSLIISDADELKDIPDENSVEFLRFKFRVLLQTKDNLFLRRYFSSILSSAKASELQTVMAKYGLAWIESNENNHEKAINFITEVEDYFKKMNLFTIDRGVIELKSGRHKLGYNTLDSAFNADRNNMYGAFSLAKACLKLGMFQKTEIMLKTVMYAMPEYSKVYFELGKLSASKKKSAEADYYLGKYYLYEGKIKLAKNKLTKASKAEDLSKELVLDAKRTLDLIARLEK